MIKQSSRVKTDTHTAALAVTSQIQASAVFPTSIESGSVPDSSTGSLPYTGLGISFLNSNIYKNKTSNNHKKTFPTIRLVLQITSKPNVLKLEVPLLKF